MAQNCYLPFLLGILYAKANLRRVHDKYSLSFQLPCTKAWVIDHVKKEFGGTVAQVCCGPNQSTRLTIQSQEGLTKLARKIKPYLEDFEELTPLHKLLTSFDDHAKRRRKEYHFRRQRRQEYIADKTILDSMLLQRPPAIPKSKG